MALVVLVGVLEEDPHHHQEEDMVNQHTPEEDMVGGMEMPIMSTLPHMVDMEEGTKLDLPHPLEDNMVFKVRIPGQKCPKF